MDTDNPKTEKPQLTPLLLTSMSGDEQFNIEQETLVGREVECHVSLDSPHVSRYHAKIIVNASGASIEDLNSSNGTYVNGKRIKDRTHISLGDEIRFDDLSFRLTSVDAGKGDSGQSDATVMIDRAAINEAAAQQAVNNPATEAAPAHNISPSTPSASTADSTGQDEDHTRMLSSEQINNIAEINKKLQKFTDLGSGPRFVAITAPIRGKVFELDSQLSENEWRFGRSTECELCVSAPSISRQHGIIRKENGRFHFTAKPGKTLRVNGVDKTEVLLKHNDEIQIGPIEFIFRLDEQKVNSSKIPENIDQTPSSSTKTVVAGIITVMLTALVLSLVLSK